jgi:hypothetical protein
MKKLNFRTIILQLLGMLFLINGVLQLKFFSVAEEFVCATTNFKNQNSECWERLFPEKEDFFSFWPRTYIGIFIGLIIGILLISFINWKSRLSSLNTIITAIVLYILIRLKFFRNGVVPQLFNSGRAAFSDDFATQCILGGILFTALGTLIIYFSTYPDLVVFKKNTTINK